MAPKQDLPFNEPQPSLFAEETRGRTKAIRSETGSSVWAVAFTDGGSRGNPGPSGYGVVVQGEDGRIIVELSEFLGIRTNNVAEYSGLLAALDYAVSHGLRRFRVVSDSELMVKQMRGQYKVRSPELRPMYEKAKRLATELDAFEIVHVLRGKNKRADQLANQAMDRGMYRRPLSTL